MGNYTIFLNVRKSQERQASKKFYNKCSENSRSQIVFRTDIFRKLTLGAPGPNLFSLLEATFPKLDPFWLFEKLYNVSPPTQFYLTALDY